jgi:hypothetical protein
MPTTVIGGPTPDLDTPEARIQHAAQVFRNASPAAMAEQGVPHTKAGALMALLDDPEARAYHEYKDAARQLADATTKLKTAQTRFQAALANMTKIVAPLGE